jgi:Leucine-rich repeat (LRR) protein
MKKRELLLRILQHLLQPKSEVVARTEVTALSNSVVEQPEASSTSAINRSFLDPTPLAMSTPEAVNSRLQSPFQFPQLEDTIKDLLASGDWEEVNQGLELMVSSLGEEAIHPFSSLIDPSALRVLHPDLWLAVLGISMMHEINAVAKLADLTGSLVDLRSIRVNKAAYADDIQIDLSLLSGALSLEELIVNGGSIIGLGSLGEMQMLRHLVLVADSIDWDTDEHEELFTRLGGLRSLHLTEWPWEHLQPLSALSQLERLDLRGGELGSLDGLEKLVTLKTLSLSDFYSLSSVIEIGNLEKLNILKLLNLSVTSLEGIENLKHLSSIELECSDLVDVTVLGTLPQLTNVRLECSRNLEGLGSLAAAGSLRQLKLADMPEYSYGERSNERFGRREMDRLCMSWKDVNTRSNRVSSLCAEGADLPVVLLGVSVLETLTGQIDTDDFSVRIEQISSHWGPELRSRAYWPQGSAGGHFSQTAPIGQWLNRATGSVSRAILDHIATVLTQQLPAIPVRA